MSKVSEPIDDDPARNDATRDTRSAPNDATREQSSAPADPDLEAAKTQLRRRIRHARRMARPSPDRAARVADAVLNAVDVVERIQANGAVAVYASLPQEPPTHELRARLRRQSVQVYLPAALPDRTLTWLLDDGGAATAWGVGARGLPNRPSVPSSDILATVGVIVVPALAATAAGQRLGQGGGYYDTLLSVRSRLPRGGPLCVAVVGADELLAELPVATHDVSVDAVVVA